MHKGAFSRVLVKIREIVPPKRAARQYIRLLAAKIETVLPFNLSTYWVLYICVSFWLLAHESRDLSQAETKVIAVTS